MLSIILKSLLEDLNSTNMIRVQVLLKFDVQPTTNIMSLYETYSKEAKSIYSLLEKHLPQIKTNTSYNKYSIFWAKLTKEQILSICDLPFVVFILYAPSNPNKKKKAKKNENT